MSKPVLLVVDDDPEVLAAVERDLRAHFKGAYRIVKAPSGKAALDAARQLKARNTPIALFLVDERMPEMTGTELLREAKALFPDARKVLLTAYADTEAAIACINHVGLDHYLMKPWDPPTERLYPVLDDLLGDWSSRGQPLFDGIRVAGASWSPPCYAVKDFLSRNHVPYRWVDVDDDPSARALLATLPGGGAKLPVVLFPDGAALEAPDHLALAEKIGLQTRAKEPFYDLVVIGAGPAGLAAAVYGASEGLRTVLVERSAPGGQAGTSSRIENYLGFPSGVTGEDLARRATAQVKRFGAELVAPQEVASIARQDPYRVVTLKDGTKLSTYAVVVATGVDVRRLEVPGLDALAGAGVYYGAAMTEAAAVRGLDVVVVGGANSAGQGAMFFSRFARTVTMIVRASSLGDAMSQYLVDRIAATPNVVVRTGAELVEVKGAERLSSVVVRDKADGTTSELPAAAVFVFIGAAPRTEMVADLLERDEQGFVITGRDLLREGKPPRGWGLDREPLPFETSVPGIFAVGDVRHGSGKRVASAVGEGSATVAMVHHYLESV